MLSGLGDWMVRTERRIRRSFGDSIDTPGRRAMAHFHLFLLDHGIFRTFWTNEAKVAPGVFRSNQPSPRRLRKIRARGINTILNLRGRSDYSQYLFEEEACDAMGMNLISHKLAARRAPTVAELTGLMDIMDGIETPFLMHCKSGADRAGFGAVMWQVYKMNVPVEDALGAHLNWRFLHLPQTSTGILDFFWREYEAAHGKSGIGLREWIETGYDRDATDDAFANGSKAV